MKEFKPSKKIASSYATTMIDKKFYGELNIAKAAKVTCIKPQGPPVSLAGTSSSGIHPVAEPGYVYVPFTIIQGNPIVYGNLEHPDEIEKKQKLEDFYDENI